MNEEEREPAYDVEEHKRLYEAGRSLRARIQAAADKQAEHRALLEDAAQFTEQTAQLGLINERLNSGTPVENLPTKDLQLLFGKVETKRIRDAVGGGRRLRWEKAVYEALPDPPPDAGEHVRKTYTIHRERAHARKKSQMTRMEKQHGWWYRELARAEVITTVVKHVQSCSVGCTRDEWAFLLHLSSFVPSGFVFDPTGNVKPPSTDPED